MVKHLRNNELAIISASYIFFYFMALIDLEPSPHYLMYCLHYILIALICSLSTKKLILCYGILNVLALWLHIPLVFADFEMAFYLFHDAKYGVGNWIIAVELLMIGFGSYNAIILFVNSWRDNGVSWYRHTLRMFKEALH